MTGVVEPIGNFNRGNRCVMCADPVTQMRDSQQKFNNVHVAFVHRSSIHRLVSYLVGDYDA